MFSLGFKELFISHEKKPIPQGQGLGLTFKVQQVFFVV
jgi:hypothetical protein